MQKVFNVRPKVGKARHVVSIHDGVKMHKDNSPFFDIKICGNKRCLQAVVKSLKKNGYSEQ